MFKTNMEAITNHKLQFRKINGVIKSQKKRGLKVIFSLKRFFNHFIISNYLKPYKYILNSLSIINHYCKKLHAYDININDNK